VGELLMTISLDGLRAHAHLSKLVIEKNTRP
jgi:hypothetical protein